MSVEKILVQIENEGVSKLRTCRIYPFDNSGDPFPADFSFLVKFNCTIMYNGVRLTEKKLSGQRRIKLFQTHAKPDT